MVKELSSIAAAATAKVADYKLKAPATQTV